jgi:uncharacterized membrane protein (UPF0127 family)
VKLTTGKVVVLVFVALGVLTTIGVFVIRSLAPAPPPALAVKIDEATVASSPFTKFRAMKLDVGGECKPVLVASTGAQRTQGLRGVTGLGPYAGMLFAFEEDIDAGFIMANTLIPLDITFYDRNGQPVGDASMTPCPGTDATCPQYGPGRTYRYALEVPGGQGPSGAISPCS